MKLRILFSVCFVFSSLTYNAFGSPGAIPVPAGNIVPDAPVKVTTEKEHVIIDNGDVEVTLSNPSGFLVGIKYKGIDNVMETHEPEDYGGYYDVSWEVPGGDGQTEQVAGTKFTVVTENENQVEVSFSRVWDSSKKSQVPLNVDKRFIVQKGVSGFYWYVIVERLKGWPDVDMDQHRIVFRPQVKMFKYMAISDEIQRIMPAYKDRVTGKPLAYPEAVLLTNPVNPELKGQVDDKYQYSMEMKDHKLKGWVSEDPKIGFWVISPSEEYAAGGPTKPELTCHSGPIALASFTSVHYAGLDMNTEYRNGEPWKKVFGPVFIYLNSIVPSNDYVALWKDAKIQMEKEVQNWPYSFVQSEDYLPAAKRGSVSGQLLVDDKFLSPTTPKEGSKAYVGLALPGAEGSWQLEVKGYQHWTEADEKGNFVIKNIHPGTYNLYGWVPGVVGDFKHPDVINVQAGNEVKLGQITYKSPRNGPTLWEIGIPDRSAAEFYVPDPDPQYVNKFFVGKPNDKYRQYGLWKRYAEIYPKDDLVFEVGKSNYSQDWFYAHVLRESGPKNYVPTPWQIVFDLPDVAPTGNYTLQLALASADETNLYIYVNDLNAKAPAFMTQRVGKDNAIARHGIHGVYQFFSAGLPSKLFVKGRNTIYLKQGRGGDSAFLGDMYDYIRLEGPPTGS
ncbi:Rhamnogalacturonate lyase [Linum grandiflorum]